MAVEGTELDFFGDERVDGELLADKLARSPLTAGEALRCGIDIGAVLKQAHARGLVHGSLSPYSIVITRTGVRLLKPEPEPGARAAPYRSPEQVRGAAADERSDIFAFGALLYELISGQRAFPGEGAELDRALLLEPLPAWMTPSPIHVAMERVIASCTQKDPARRCQRVQNALAELKFSGRAAPLLEEARDRFLQRALRRAAAGRRGFGKRKFRKSVVPPAFDGPEYPAPARPASRRLWVIAVVAFVAVAATGLAARLIFYQPSPLQVRFDVTKPDHTSYPSTPAVSPDGRYITLTGAGPEGKRMLWLRPLDALNPRPLAGTEGASAPFWSPDSQSIAFFGDNSLKRVRVNGGPVETICPSEAMAGGGAWNRKGVILFAPSLRGGLYLVAAGGGSPQPVVTLSEARAERSARWPQFLPDGNHFVFFLLTADRETTGVYLGALDSPEYRRLFVAESNATYSAASADSPRTGYLLYVRDRSLVAQPFSASHYELSGDAVPVLGLRFVRTLSLAPVSVSSNATLVYEAVGEPTRQLVWMDRTGRQVGIAGEPGDWIEPPRISPDGRRAVAANAGPDDKTVDLWLIYSNGSAVRLNSRSQEGYPVWSPDGLRVAHTCDQEGQSGLCVEPVDGGRAELLYKSAGALNPSDWSRDGRYLLFSAAGQDTRSDVWALSLADRRAAAVIQTINSEDYPALSPDGKWLAFQSDQSGPVEVYVQAFDGPTAGTRRQWKVSSEPAGLPRWRGDGAELFYMREDGTVMAAAVHPKGDDFQFDPPHQLFQTLHIPNTWNVYDVSPDGQRFLVNLPHEWANPASIVAVTDWLQSLRN